VRRTIEIDESQKGGRIQRPGRRRCAGTTTSIRCGAQVDVTEPVACMPPVAPCACDSSSPGTRGQRPNAIPHARRPPCGACILPGTCHPCMHTPVPSPSAGDPMVAACSDAAYVGVPKAASHPDNLARVATLPGLDVAPADRCRRLEPGGGDGANLLPMAATLPAVTIVGCDFARRPIERAQRMAAGLDLANGAPWCAMVRRSARPAGGPRDLRPHQCARPAFVDSTARARAPAAVHHPPSGAERRGIRQLRRRSRRPSPAGRRGMHE
jgi:hypothetical protein